jgi:hypothetical protein
MSSGLLGSNARQIIFCGLESLLCVNRRTLLSVRKLYLTTGRAAAWVCVTWPTIGLGQPAAATTAVEEGRAVRCGGGGCRGGGRNH